jgi:glycosyltransferase involved in cell wall biosynthesis
MTSKSTQPLHIALLHYSTPPIVGGVESVLARHAELMTQAGHTVSIIAARGQQWHNDIPIRLIPLADSRHPDILAAKNDLDAGTVPLQFDRLVEQLIVELRTALKGVDILIPHNVCSLNKNLVLTAAIHQIQQNDPTPTVILWHHDLAWTTPRYQPELHDGYPWDLLRTHWPGVVQVVISEPRRVELAKLMGIDPNSITVVPNGVSTTEFHKLEPQTIELFERLNLAEAEPLLLLPVRLTPRKNIELAVQTLAELKLQFPNAALVVTGPEGPHNPANAAYKQKLLELRNELGLQNNVYFLAEHVSEFLPDPVIADFFRLADALLMPSREEGFGIPLVEAAFSRLPVFCADIPPLRELGGEEASYFSPNEQPAIVARLIHQKLSNDLSYRFAVRARRKYSWRGIYETVIEPLLQTALQPQPETTGA